MVYSSCLLSSSGFTGSSLPIVGTQITINVMSFDDTCFLVRLALILILLAMCDRRGFGEGGGFVYYDK